MTDFVIVIAAAAALAAPAAPGSTAQAGAAAASSVPLSAPTVGFRTYADAASCEQATATLAAPAGKRFVCVPVEPMAGEMANAY
jgi:hypothetical protein